MLHQKQYGPSCFFVAACNAADIEFTAEQEAEYLVVQRARNTKAITEFISSFVQQHVPATHYTTDSGIAQEIPTEGKGLLIIARLSFPGDSKTHAVAYDSGMMCDSRMPQEVFISFEDFRKFDSLYANSEIVEVIPFKEEK